MQENGWFQGMHHAQMREGQERKNSITDREFQ